MYKLSILILPMFLIGCSTLKTIDLEKEELPLHPTETVVSPITVAAPAPAPMPMPLPPPMEVASHPTDKIDEVVEIETTGQSMLSSVVKKVKIAAIKKIEATIIDKADDVIKSLDSTPTVPENPMPIPLGTSMPPAAHDSRTGAKIQFFGIDLELWLGQNDSWSTIFKMVTFMLLTYGGLRWINSVFGKRRIRRR